MRPTLFEYAGGEAGLLRLAHAHHARCLADPELSHPFSHPDQHPQHVERLAAYWIEVLGGRPAYTGLGGTESEVIAMHSGEGDLSALNRIFVECFVRAMDDAGLPADPAFRAAMRSYMEWAVQDFSRYPDDPADVPPDLRVPRWDWDGLVAPG
jgi:hemoglobin